MTFIRHLGYILLKAEEKNFFVNITKLQKLLYCCYGAVLAVYDWRLTEEHPQAWPYGPVFPRTFRSWEKKKIRMGEDGGFSQQCPPQALKLIDETLDFFGKYTATQLSNWSHQPGSPWALATDGGKNLPAPMDDFQIAQYFRNKVVRNEPKATAAS